MNHKVQIWQRDDTYFGHIEELGVLVSATDLNALWCKLEEETCRVRERFNEAGISDLLPSSSGNTDTTAVTAQRRFLLRLGAIAGVTLLLILVAARQLSSAGKEVAGAFHKELTTHLRLSQIVTGLQEQSPEKREELHRNLRALVHEIKPYFDALEPLFDGDHSPCSDASTNAGKHL